MATNPEVATTTSELGPLGQQTSFDLDNTLVIDDNVFNVNAVRAEVADKTEHTLTVKTYKINNVKDDEGKYKESTASTFNGEYNKTIHVVDALEGGGFAKPITVPQISDITNPVNPNRYNNYVLNYADLLSVIESKTGAGYFTWGNHTFSWSDGTLVDKTAVDSAQRTGIVTGTRAELGSFAETNYYKKYLPIYLYICTDTSDIFFGNSKDTTTKQLCSAALEADEAFKLSKLGGGDNYTYEKLTNKFSNINAQFENIRSIMGDLEESIFNAEFPGDAQKVLTFIELLGYAFGIEDSRIDEIRYHLTNDRYTDEAKNELATVNRARLANHANTADTATRSTYATHDGQMREYQSNYYHISQMSTVGWYADPEDPDITKPNTEKLIIISNSAPNPNSGNPGDIWIKYT